MKEWKEGSKVLGFVDSVAIMVNVDGYLAIVIQRILLLGLSARCSAEVIDPCRSG